MVVTLGRIYGVRHFLRGVFDFMNLVFVLVVNLLAFVVGLLPLVKKFLARFVRPFSFFRRFERVGQCQSCHLHILIVGQRFSPVPCVYKTATNNKTKKETPSRNAHVVVVLKRAISSSSRLRCARRRRQSFHDGKKHGQVELLLLVRVLRQLSACAVAAACAAAGGLRVCVLSFASTAYAIISAIIPSDDGRLRIRRPGSRDG